MAVKFSKERHYLLLCLSLCSALDSGFKFYCQKFVFGHILLKHEYEFVQLGHGSHKFWLLKLLKFFLHFGDLNDLTENIFVD